MIRSHLDELSELEESYWWHVAKRELAVRLLRRFAPAPGRLIEGGIGSSRNLIEFRDLGYDVSGFDIMQDAVLLGRNRGLSTVAVHDLQEPWPVEPRSVRAVVLLDVLEHTADPVQVLSHIRDVLEPGGALILTVPAYPFLYSSWDRQLGHFQRYTVRQLQTEAASAGLRTAWWGHWNSFSLPAAIAARKLSSPDSTSSASFPRIPRPLNSLLLNCARLERGLLFSLGVPFGLSIAGVFVHAD